jgi:hypothetical protein
MRCQSHPIITNVPPPHQLLKQLVEFYETQQGNHAIEGDIDTIIFNPIA